jgi:effector-binding domain-containing protein
MLELSLTQRAAQHTAVVRAMIPTGQIPAFLGHAYGAVIQALSAQGMTPVGEPFAYYLHAPTPNVEMEAGFPVATQCMPSGDVVPSELPGGTIASVTHVGPYEAMVETYNQLNAWATEQGLVLGESMWETYLIDPQQEPDSNRWRTQVLWPVATARVPAKV